MLCSGILNVPNNKIRIYDKYQIYNIYKFIALKGNWEIPPASSNFWLIDAKTDSFNSAKLDILMSQEVSV